MSEYCIIRVKDGTEILVDAEDYPLLSRHTWYIKPTTSSLGLSYAVSQVGTHHLNMHRLIMGTTPNSAFEIDHINHNGLDNRKENLRFVPKSLNSHNKRKRGKTFSQYKGVCRKSREESDKWQATIRFNNKQYYLGIYDNEVDAAKAYDRAAEKFYGPNVCPNFPKEVKNAR